MNVQYTLYAPHSYCVYVPHTDFIAYPFITSHVITTLISAFFNSGYVGKVWSILKQTPFIMQMQYLPIYYIILFWRLAQVLV